jgi:hypothetical protein
MTQYTVCHVLISGVVEGVYASRLGLNPLVVGRGRDVADRWPLSSSMGRDGSWRRIRQRKDNEKMSTHNERDIAAALKAAPPILLGAGPRTLSTKAAPDADETWTLPNGEAWVFYGKGHRGLVSPVIMADGFNSGPSTLPFSWTYLEETDFPLISALRQRGKDVILLGFTERSASILDNSDAAIAAIEKATATRNVKDPLVVGGFSMGGLVTRYALAKMEADDIPHHTGVYFSYDSPHRGAYIPISLQAFAHFIRSSSPAFSDQMNSDAAQQLLWRHIETEDDKPEISPKRVAFLEALQEVGNWPRRPRLLAVANGVGTGIGNGIDTGKTAVLGKAISLVSGTDLRTMPAAPDNLAAILKLITSKEVQDSGPAIDGAPGGTLDSFKILADVLNDIKFPPMGVDNPIEEHCFVPAVSAVDIRDLDTNDDLYTNIGALDSNDSGVDEYRLASHNEPHTKVTEELCTWLLDRF